MRVLFVERADAQGGGSVSSLRWLVGALAGSHAVQVAVFGNPAWRRLFQATGIPTLTVLPNPSWLTGRLLTAAGLRRTRAYAPLHSVLSLALDTLPVTLRCAQLCARERPDLLHANDGLPMQRAEILAALLAGVPMVLHVRSVGWLDALDRLLATRVRHVLAVSEAAAAPYRRIGLAADRLSVVYDCTPLPPPLAEGERRERRRQAGLDDGACWAVTAGRLVSTKGVGEALEAVSRVRSRGVDLRLLVLGDGPQAPLLREVARRLGMQPFVRFADWQDDALGLLPLADVLLHPTQGLEGLGRAILEGMACGLPVVATDVGGIPEAFEDGVSGLLARGAGAGPLVEPLEALARDPQRRRAMGRAAREEAERRYSIAAHRATVEAIYARALSSAAR